jgi:putative (di)nucleoside polyphosphate hydrolase
MPQPQTFRANVGIVVLDDRWEVLALERIDKATGGGTGQWQMPQGGLDEGEEPEQAWPRELMEEIHVGADGVELLGSYPEWLAYELPPEVRALPSAQAKQGRGQVQKWFFVRLKPGATIRLDTADQEFIRYRWMSLERLAEETWSVRRAIYRKLALHVATLRDGGT